jgi:hypothetical protein
VIDVTRNNELNVVRDDELDVSNDVAMHLAGAVLGVW